MAIVQVQNPKLGLRGWEKWMLMSIIILCLSAIVLYFNLTVYGIWDGAPYIGVVLFIVVLSFVITRHIKRNPVTSAFLTAAFVFEVMLAIALGVNAGYSLSVQREMSMAKQGAQERKSELDSIGKLDRRAQRNATRGMRRDAKSAQDLFSDNERVLWIILMTELGIALLATFVLLGLSVFDKNLDGVPDVLQRQRPEDRMIDPGRMSGRTFKTRAGFTAPSLPRHDAYAKDRGRVETPKFDSRNEATRVETQNPIKTLREHLQVISEHHPGYSFKADEKPNHVIIRMMRSERGREVTEHSIKYPLSILEAVEHPDFRSTLVRKLRAQKWPIEDREY